MPAALAALSAAGLAACGQSSPPGPTASPTPGPPPLQACSASSLPEAGFVPDPQHSGELSVSRYSPNGDIQAALVYFRFRTGQRQVFTDVPATAGASPGTPPAAPAAGPPAPGHDELVVCDALEFPGADGARGFVGAFRQLRLDAGQQEVPAPAAVGDRRVAVADHDQSFVGYAIQHANGAEIAASQGSRFYSVSVFGPAPTLQTALTVLRSMMGPSR